MKSLRATFIALALRATAVELATVAEVESNGVASSMGENVPQLTPSNPRG